MKNIGTKFIYSQQAIDLVQQYMDKFPRVFELLSTQSDNGVISISDFDENNNRNGVKCVGEIRQWLQSLPYYRAGLKPVDLSRLSDDAIKEVEKAIQNAVRILFYQISF